MKGLDDPDNLMEPIALKADISRMRKLEEDLCTRIPETVQVGMFQINCKDIRNMYT